MTLPPDEHADDLYWHALNYRTAATQHAEAMWQDLQACVDRKVKAAVLAEREACAALCDTRSADHWHDYKDGPLGVRGVAVFQHASDEAEGCAAAIRARGE